MNNIPEDRTTHLIVGGTIIAILFLLIVVGGTILGQVTGAAWVGYVVNIAFGFLLGRKAARWYSSLPPRRQKYF